MSEVKEVSLSFNQKDEKVAQKKSLRKADHVY